MKLYNLLFGNDHFNNVIVEMPIKQFKNVGDWTKSSSFRHDVDRKLLTTPKAVEKIHKQWEKTPYDFDMYLLNLPKANKPQFREVGEVSMDFIRNELKLTPEEFPDNNPNAITIIFNGNFGDQRYMASGWILAHRLGHAFARGRTGGETARLWIEFRNYLRKTVAEILKDVYNIDVTENSYDFKNNAQKDKILKYVAQQLGTMKSARDKNIRNWYEFAYELLAQYLITDKITFNELPKNIVTGIAGWGRKETRRSQDEPTRELHGNSLEMHARDIAYYLDNILSSAVGKIFLM